MAFAPLPHIIYNNFSGQFNIAFVSITSQPINNNKLLLLTQKHTTFAFAVSALLSILQLKYNGSATAESSPLFVHPIIMGIAVISVLLYCLACDAELRICASHPCRRASNNANVTNIIHHVVRLLGYCSLASLASVLAFPFSVPPLASLVFDLFSVLLLLLSWVYNRILIGRRQSDTMHDLVSIVTSY